MFKQFYWACRACWVNPTSEVLPKKKGAHINHGDSASPLNNEAAQLHQNDPEEYQKKVLARHQDIDD